METREDNGIVKLDFFSKVTFFQIYIYKKKPLAHSLFGA